MFAISEVRYTEVLFYIPYFLEYDSRPSINSLLRIIASTGVAYPLGIAIAVNLADELS